MPNPVLQRVILNLRSRHGELIRWLGIASDSEIRMRLGPHDPKAVNAEVGTLSEMIEKAERSELGRCVICKEEVDSVLFEMDYTASVCLDHLDAEQRSRLENELELSAKVQRALLPQSAPSIAGWEIAAFSQPASIVGGDYFDFLKFGDNAHAIIIADVMGKGMPASMLVSNLQASLRIIVPESNTPEEVVRRLNRLFHHNIRLTKFVSLFVGRLDPAAGTLAYVNAGHHPPLHLRPTGYRFAEIRQLRPTGPAVGLVKDPVFSSGTTTVEPGDLLVFYTDGIVEARGKEGAEFGDERLRMILVQAAGGSISEAVQNVRSQLRMPAEGKPLHDDATLIVYRRTVG